MKKHLSCLAAICLLLTFGLGPATIMAETESAVETEAPTEIQEEVQSPAEAEATAGTAEKEEGKHAENMPETQSQKDFKLNEELHGFVLTRIEDLPDIASTAYFFTHQKSGAEVLWLKNEDPFKVFAACYKTEPGITEGKPISSNTLFWAVRANIIPMIFSRICIPSRRTLS